MCTPIRQYTGNIETLETKTKDLKAMANMNAEVNRNAFRYMQELFFNAIIGISIFVLLFGFVVLIKVLIG
jgi:hypothetical protein|nr:MAG TPA: vesicle-associated membrane protein 2 [Caudoviricetes sp.]DAT09209.1 MAG TPA: vesicle-associated membrane protein 2 [Caudoviricetes sp.]